ncbi:ABC transporter substrate-binding protein [Peptostreptococcus porci]|uniref:ABC transporter substrate-binding protein n=1 Tax=Peptostreptococcus porci TaxID=2652282 RepID=UPI002A91EE7A|nr:ABC transporter substrate-binding protein [Peptostreptococcus porci]MDY6231131.1 ABC transporter substrate-binding protein [Peptostreptococcus porci]
MKKLLSVLLSLVLTAGVVTGCKSVNDSADNKEPAVVAKVGALKGPTSMGMVKMMSENDADEKGYSFSIQNSVDEIVPKIVKGEFDIAAVPSNLSSVLYNKTKGKVVTLAINTLGVLYVVENGDTVKSLEDLKGKTIYSSGKGASPEYTLNYILQANGIDPQKDVTVDYKTEHTEALQTLMKDKDAVAVLPQPFVTVATTKSPSLKSVLNLSEEWDKAAQKNGSKSALIMGVVVANKDFVEKYPQKVADFMSKYKKSVDFTNNNVDEAAKLIAAKDIVPEPIAKKAIPFCNITFIAGSEMKDKLSGYLEVLSKANPQSVGGKLPNEDFYYIGETK